MSVKNLITNSRNITENERKDFLCDATQSVHSILQWKVHILTTVNQDIAKQLVLERLDDLTAFIVIDFFYEVSGTSIFRINEKLVWKGWESDACSCVIMKENSDPDQTEELLDGAYEVKFKKRTYITFIGKSAQDVVSVIAIHQYLLHQLQTNLPPIKYIIDKSDNGGCYHNKSFLPGKQFGHEKP